MATVSLARRLCVAVPKPGAAHYHRVSLPGTSLKHRAQESPRNPLCTRFSACIFSAGRQSSFSFQRVTFSTASPSVSPASQIEAARRDSLNSQVQDEVAVPELLHREVKNERDLASRVDALKTEVVGANWGDYLTIVMDLPFWEEELRIIEEEAQPFIANSTVQAQMKDLRRIFDLLYQVTDIRDHVNQLIELGSRAAGIAGTGLKAGEEVTNVDDHAHLVAGEYDRLMKEYPEYCSKVDDVLGSGLAILRSKHRFTFSALHRFFY